MAKLPSDILVLDASKIKWSGKHGVMDKHAFPRYLADGGDNVFDLGFFVKGKNETRLFGFDRVEYKHHESFPSMKVYIFRSIWGNTITIRG